MVYGDLLTDELDCDDTYLDLANKVKEFLHMAATHYSHAQYVMVADDDLYLRVDAVVRHFRRLGPQTRYYSGQVLWIQNLRKDAPTRDPNVRYSLSEAQYPISELPPFALGAYFFLSMDCVEFISRNRRRLRDLGGMDDITVALWMLVIQVHPQLYRKHGFLRLEPCGDKFVAFGDLSSLAISEVHNNLVMNRSFCHGFEPKLWLKSSGHAPANGVHRKLPRFAESLQFEFVIDKANCSLRITTTISTRTLAGVKASYSPSQDSFATYSRRLCAATLLHFPTAMNSSSCVGIASQLITEVGNFYQHLEVSGEVEAAQLSLWRQNLIT